MKKVERRITEMRELEKKRRKLRKLHTQEEELIYGLKDLITKTHTEGAKR